MNFDLSAIEDSKTRRSVEEALVEMQSTIERQAQQIAKLSEACAFPQQWFDGRTFAHQDPVRRNGGMTLRDYFAAKALSGMVRGTWLDANERHDVAKRAYLIADEMLKERAK